MRKTVKGLTLFELCLAPNNLACSDTESHLLNGHIIHEYGWVRQIFQTGLK